MRKLECGMRKSEMKIELFNKLIEHSETVILGTLGILVHFRHSLLL